MKYCDLMILGFGGVGQAFTQTLNDQTNAVGELVYRVVAVSDFYQGWAYDAQGLDLGLLLDKDRRSKKMRAFDVDPIEQTLKLIRDSNVNVMVEASYTTHDGQPAIDYFREALSNDIILILATPMRH